MPRSIHSIKTPGQNKISGRTSSVTNAFINGIVPFHKPTLQEKQDAVTALGMSPDDIRCSYCGDEATEWDHLNALIDEKVGTGYFTEIANLVPACGKCNQSKGNRSWKEWLRSSADRSPANRKVPGMERRIALLEAYEARFKPAIVKLDEHVGAELWARHLQNHADLMEAMRKANLTAEIIRREIAAKFGRRRLVEGKSIANPVNQPADTVRGIEPGSRNEDKFVFDGATLGKGRLVLAVIAKYVAEHPGISQSGLRAVFPDGLQGTRHGVFTLRSEGETIYQKTGIKRHFLKATEVLKLSDGEFVVSNQWGSRNFPGLLIRLRELGYAIG